MKQTFLFDTEIIGKKSPIFLLCCKNIKTKETFSFWGNNSTDKARFIECIADTRVTWVGFNSLKFDLPLLAAYYCGYDAAAIKTLADRIIRENLMPWDAYRHLGCEGFPVPIDHIDLFEVAPGVRTSLKTYAGRMHCKNLLDLPFDPDQALTERECDVLERYCLNDLVVTETLFKRLKSELALRVRLGKEHALDLRSKSDAQIAEAILKKEARLSKGTGSIPKTIVYKAPLIIQTTNPQLLELIAQIEQTKFKIDDYGSPILPEFLEQPIKLNGGTYKVGIGGLHSQHDLCRTDGCNADVAISDFDVASYYPTIMLNGGIIPDINGRGTAFMDAYRALYEQRAAAKQAGDKKTAQSLKITLNGTFGKLGNRFCSFYSPELMLAVTLTGQLNLLCLIDAISQQVGVTVLSANTDGLIIKYPRRYKNKLQRVFDKNSRLTGFTYEETEYRSIAMKDVNNYIAVKSGGEIKAKGLYSEPGLMKNPTAPICSQAVAAFLKDNTPIAQTINRARKLEPFLSIRAVKGGAIQHVRAEQVDDWLPVEHGLWVSESTAKTVKRVSRPPPFEQGTGGTPVGRVARWYMTTENLPPITYVSNGNKVPKTDGAKLCMTLPGKLPNDLNRAWYIAEAYAILRDIGAPHLPFQQTSNNI